MKRATGRKFSVDAMDNISIHALVKRATETVDVSFSSVDISIHALVKRATELLSLLNSKLKIFQSTPS